MTTAENTVMIDPRGVTIQEWKPATQGEYVPRFYSDAEIEELFQSDDGSLVMALLRRAQKAEAEIARLRGLMEPI